MVPPTHFVTQNVKIGGDFYTKHLEKDLLPAIGALYPNGDGIFVQDGASAHTSDVCQNYLQDAMGNGDWVKKTQWPPKSPDLNPLDYHVWNAIEEKVYEGRTTPFESTDQLRRRIKYVWESAINLEHLRKAIKQFRPRLRAVVDNEGGPITHLFK